MLKSLIEKVPNPRQRNMLLTGGGMVALLSGRKVEAATMFARGIQGLEQQWRERHPEFGGGFAERWAWSEAYYEQTHQDPTNRVLHVIGIPMIIGGTVGLAAFKPYRPLWFASAGAFTGGWALNFVGHAVFEKRAPAFADDPLGFLAGPVWDAKQLVKKVRRGGRRTVEA